MENILSHRFGGNICLQLLSSSCHGALPLLFFPSAVPLLWCKWPNPVTLIISDFYGIQHPNSNFSLVFPRTMYWFYTLCSQPLHSESSSLKWNSFGFFFLNIQCIKKPLKDIVRMMMFCLRKKKSFMITQKLRNSKTHYKINVTK